MNLNIENIPTCPIAYVRRVGAYGVGNTQTMEELKSWAKRSNLMDSETVILGIAHDNPQTTPNEACRYDACIILKNKDITENDGVQQGVIVGGEYAVFTIEHTAKAMQQAWAIIFPTLAESGYYPDPARPTLERYAAKQVAQHLCEICIPIYFG